MSRRADPFCCPYCGETDLWPHEAQAAAWECRGCLRAFTVQLHGMIDRPRVATSEVAR